MTTIIHDIHDLKIINNKIDNLLKLLKELYIKLTDNNKINILNQIEEYEIQLKILERTSDTTKCIQIYTSSKIKNIHINTNI